MKIFFLNAWRNTQNTLKQFILDESKDTDIFCFQESVDKKSQIFSLDWLPDYQYFFEKKRINKANKFDNCTFILKKYLISDSKSIGQDDLTIGFGLYNQIKISNNQILNVCNIHGHARPGNKQDTPARIHQSQLIIDFLKNKSGPKIIGGDFNLDINTKSVQMFEDNGYINLIKKFNIPTTRNKISWANYENKQLFADFLFISPDVKVINFSVPNLLVSDHLPMILNFEI